MPVLVKCLIVVVKCLFSKDCLTSFLIHSHLPVVKQVDISHYSSSFRVLKFYFLCMCVPLMYVHAPLEYTGPCGGQQAAVWRYRAMPNVGAGKSSKCP